MTGGGGEGPPIPGTGFQAWAAGRGWDRSELEAASAAWGEVERRALRWARVFGREGSPAGRLGGLLADAAWIMAEAVDALAADRMRGDRAWADLDDAERDVERAGVLGELVNVDAGRYWAILAEFGPEVGTAVQAGRERPAGEEVVRGNVSRFDPSRVSRRRRRGRGAEA